MLIVKIECFAFFKTERQDILEIGSKCEVLQDFFCACVFTSYYFMSIDKRKYDLLTDVFCCCLICFLFINFW